MKINERTISTPEAFSAIIKNLMPGQRVLNSNGEKPASNTASGFVGTSMWSNVFNEEYLQELKGSTGAKQYEKMIRGDYQIKYIEKATVGTIKSANYAFTIPNDIDGLKMQKACDWQLRKGFNKTLGENLNDILSYMTFGNSVFEPVQWTAYADIPEIGLGWRLETLGFRDQKTITGWAVSQGKIEWIRQQAISGTGAQMIDVKIPGENCLVFTYDRRGDNLEGIAMLRPAYGPYFRKNIYLKLLGIGLEKGSLGLVLVTVPANDVGSEQETAFLEAIKNYMSHQNAYLKKTISGDFKEGYNVEIIKLDFNSASIIEAVKLEDTAISKCVAAQFSEVAQGGNGGAYNAIIGMVTFFLNTLATEAAYTADKLQPIFDKFCLYNFGKKKEYPQLQITGINDAVGEELARILNYLKSAGLLTPQIEDEIHIRAKYKLPEMSAATLEKRIAAEIEHVDEMPVDEMPEDDKGSDVSPDAMPAEETMMRFKKQPDDYIQKILAGIEGKDIVAALLKLEGGYNNGVRSWLLAQKDLIMAEVVRAFKENDPMGYLKGLVIINKAALKEIVLNNLIDSMLKGYEQGEKILKAKKRKNKIEYRVLVQLGKIDKFIPANKKWLNNAASVTVELIADTTYKKTITAAQTAIDKGFDIKAASFFISNELDDYISVDANFGAGALVSKSLDQGRDNAYYDAGVEIIGWLYLNEDPVTEICNWLSGRTAKEGDPAVDEFTPPNHWGCKSFTVPIMADEPQPDNWDGWDVPASVQAAQTLLKSCGHKHHVEVLKCLI